MKSFTHTHANNPIIENTPINPRKQNTNKNIPNHSSRFDGALH
jgi:hypothetical protein